MTDGHAAIHGELSRLYQRRFTSDEQARKQKVWAVLCSDFFQRYVRPTDRVLDLGAGYCEFINHIRCGQKIAVDLNEDAALHAASDVKLVHARSTDLGIVPDDSVDVVFVSNFLEHLDNKDDFFATLRELQRILVPEGRLLILQPNIRFLADQYWDFVDHQLPLSDRSVVEALELLGMVPIEVRPRFLPYTTKSRLPQWPWLIRLYLRLPPAQWLFGRQAWVVALKPAHR